MISSDWTRIPHGWALAAVLMMAASGAVVAGVGGEATGLTATGVTCRNLTTGQSVSSSSQATDWDCASLGLIVNAGDRVRAGIRGVLPDEAGASGFVQSLPGDFASRSLVDDDVGIGDIAARDLDGDGDLDVAFEDLFLWLENLGGPDPSFVQHFLSGPEFSATALRVMDVDFDGKLDIVASFGGNSNKLMWFENDGGSPPDFVGRPIDSHPGLNIFQFEGADVDGDGDMDFFASTLGGQDERIVWIEDVGTSYVKHLIEEGPATTVSRLVAMDADGDGDPDLILADINEDTVSWYENDGASFVVEHPVDPAFSPNRLHKADLDGDGDLDVIASPSSQTDGELRWYETVGDGHFLIHSLGFFEEHDGDLIAVGDFSADGRADILFGGVLSWLENEGGAPPSFTEHAVAGTVFTQFITHGDIDLDGRLDVVGISSPGSDLWVWHENQIGLRLSVSGLTVHDFTCHNRSTGQRLRVPTSETSIDCEQEGLTVNPGDEIEVTTRGVAN